MLLWTCCKKKFFFCRILISNHFWIIIARSHISTFIVLFKSFPALPRFFDFYSRLLEVLTFLYWEYQHVLLVWWLYHLILIYVHVNCSTKILCSSQHLHFLSPLWVHSAFKIIYCIFLLDACFDRYFPLETFCNYLNYEIKIFPFSFLKFFEHYSETWLFYGAIFNWTVLKAMKTKQKNSNNNRFITNDMLIVLVNKGDVLCIISLWFCLLKVHQFGKLYFCRKSYVRFCDFASEISLDGCLQNNCWFTKIFNNIQLFIKVPARSTKVKRSWINWFLFSLS